MAKIKYSALVSDMRNKLNGSVMSKNRYGSYVRNNVTPVNPRSSRQQEQRQIFGSLAQAWRTLTEAQRQSWISGTRNFPFNDIFGDQKFLSGQTLFIKLNANLEKIGEARVLSAPTPAGVGELVISSDVTWDPTGNMIVFSGDPVELPAGTELVTYATPPIPAGVNFVRNRYRFAGYGIDTSEPMLNYPILTAGSYTAMFGTPESGTKIFVRFALVNTETGEQGPPLEYIVRIP